MWLKVTLILTIIMHSLCCLFTSDLFYLFHIQCRTISFSNRFLVSIGSFGLRCTLMLQCHRRRRNDAQRTVRCFPASGGIVCVLWMECFPATEKNGMAYVLLAKAERTSGSSRRFLWSVQNVSCHTVTHRFQRHIPTYVYVSVCVSVCVLSWQLLQSIAHIINRQLSTRGSAA